MTKTHWKKLTNPNYLGTYSLPTDGGDMLVEIESVSTEKVMNITTNREEECIVAKLKGEKPLILNKTNMKMITKIAGTPYVEEWAGIKIKLYSKKVKAFGEWVDGLRVKPALEELTPRHSNWGKCKSAIRSGEFTMKDIRSKYFVTSTTEQKLCR